MTPKQSILADSAWNWNEIYYIDNICDLYYFRNLAYDKKYWQKLQWSFDI